MALADLEFSRKRIAGSVRKTLQSAIANAENNHQLDVDNLVVAEAHVGKALVMKRFNPRARGRVGRILKPFSNLTVVVREVEESSLRTRAWDRKSIRSGFASGSTRPGIPAGSPTTTEYGNLLHEDVRIRDTLMEDLKQAAVSRVVVERPHKKCRVTIHTARPGIVIGKKGADIEKLRKKVASMTKSEVHINIVEVRKPEIDAHLVAQSIAQQLERRVAFRRAMKRAVQSAMRLGAQGIRISCGGRLGGAEIARSEWYREGRVPLHTLRADIDYGHATAHTAYGTSGDQGVDLQGRDPRARSVRLGEARARRHRIDAARGHAA